MLTPLPSRHNVNAWGMNNWDAATAALGLPTFTLMENAARAAWHVLHTSKPHLSNQRILILMGNGNNGGDAAALARMLHDDGLRVLVVHTKPLRAMKGIAAKHTQLARACGVSFLPMRRWLQGAGNISDNTQATNIAWATPEIFVDGLLGTGFQSALRPDMEALIHEVNYRKTLNNAFVLALDVPSGLCATTGYVHSIAIKANATVTFEAAKPGLVLPHAKAYTGILHTASIGMPAIIAKNHPTECALLDERIMRYHPASSTFKHKGKGGHVLIIGGSTGLCGAPLLSAKGAMAAGAGKVTLAMPAPLLNTLNIPPDSMTLPLASEQWNDDSTVYDTLQTMIKLVDSIVLGPGIGRCSQSLAFVSRLLQDTSRPPTLIDADALYALVKNNNLFASLRHNDILTPHPGEAAALLQAPVAKPHERFTSLASLQNLSPHNPVWVYKGAGTLIGQYSEHYDGQSSEHYDGQSPGHTKHHETQPSCLVSPFDIPQLAVAGSGDVLAGIIATFMAQGVPSLYAAGLGVYRHAQAGLHLAKKSPHRGNTASDIAQILCETP